MDCASILGHSLGLFQMGNNVQTHQTVMSGGYVSTNLNVSAILPCIVRFKSFKAMKMSLKLASFASQLLSLKCAAQGDCLLERSFCNSSLSSNTRVRAFPLDSHLTSVCRSRRLWSASMYWHNNSNKRVFRAWALMWLMTRIASFRTVWSSGDIFLLDSISQWIMHILPAPHLDAHTAHKLTWSPYFPRQSIRPLELRTTAMLLICPSAAPQYPWQQYCQIVEHVPAC